MLKHIPTLFLLLIPIFFKQGANPYQIPYFEEVYLIFLLLSALLYFTAMRKITRIDLLILIIPIYLLVLSTVGSIFNYNQPYYYGVLAARTVFFLYTYFVAMRLLENKGLRYLISSIKIAALFLIAIGFLYHFGILPSSPFYEGLAINQNLGVSFMRVNRCSAGRSILIIAFTFIASEAIAKPKLAKVLIALFYLSYFIIVVQERGVLIALIVASVATVLMNSSVFSSLSKGKVKYKFLVIFFPLVISIFLLLRSTVVANPLSVINNFDLTQRYQTLMIVLNDFNETGLLFPHGLLWNSWTGGSFAIYGFDLAPFDIGIVGTFYVFGIVALVPILFIYCKSLFQVIFNDNSLMYFDSPIFMFYGFLFIASAFNSQILQEKSIEVGVFLAFYNFTRKRVLANYERS